MSVVGLHQNLRPSAIDLLTGKLLPRLSIGFMHIKLSKGTRRLRMLYSSSHVGKSCEHALI